MNDVSNQSSDVINIIPLEDFFRNPEKSSFQLSPNGENITFSAKSGKSDVLFILNLLSDELKEFRFDLEGIFQPIWNPNKSLNEIAFIGNDGYQSDIYIYNYDNKDLTNLTNDWFSDSDISSLTDATNIHPQKRHSSS